MSLERKLNKESVDTYLTKKKENVDTFPCWLLVTLRFCVTLPPLAGSVLLLAGSKCSWRNWKIPRTTDQVKERKLYTKGQKKDEDEVKKLKSPLEQLPGRQNQ